MSTLRPVIYVFDRSGMFIQSLRTLAPSSQVREITFGKYPTLEQAVELFGIDTIISPGNSYGRLDGGFDQAISDFYHNRGVNDPGRALQQVLMREKQGFNPVANALVVDEFEPKLIHVPTMEVPSLIPPGQPVVFNCMWSILSGIRLYNRMFPRSIERVLMTGLGTGTGGVSPQCCAQQVALALHLFENPTDPDSTHAQIAKACQEGASGQE